MNIPKADKIRYIPMEQTHPYQDHHFTPYKRNRLKELSESIRERGVIHPVILWQCKPTSYTILSGHNRVAAAKLIGEIDIPAIVLQDLSQEEADYIVEHCNINQQSFCQMKESEKACIIEEDYEAIKKQGKRTDIIRAIDSILAEDSDLENPKYIGQRCRDSRYILSSKYGISANSVKQYVRIAKLPQILLDKLDKRELSREAAYYLSFFDAKDQLMIETILRNFKECTVNKGKAQKLQQILKQEREANPAISYSDELFLIWEALEEDYVKIRFGDLQQRIQDWVHEYAKEKERTTVLKNHFNEALRQHFIREGEITKDQSSDDEIPVHPVQENSGLNTKKSILSKKNSAKHIIMKLSGGIEKNEK